MLDEFARRDPKKELAALLVGEMSEGSEGIFLVVEDAIEVPVGDAQSGRFGPRSWQHARRVAQAKHKDRTIVGWFHTHHGSGLDATVEEKETQARYFPESWQVLYVVDPIVNDRNFLHPRDGRLVPFKGFRVFGRTEGVTSLDGPTDKERAPKVRSEEQLRERYVERSLEKILRMLRRPAVRPMDVVIVLLLLGNAAVTLMRPVPTARVDTTALTESQKKLSEQVKTVNVRLEKLEQHLAAMRVIDEQLAIAPTATPAATPTVTATATATATPAAATPAPSASPTTTGAPEPGSDDVKSYKVATGDTLSIICEKFYGSSGEHVVRGLAHFNQIKGMSIFPGDTLKIPAKDKLH